MKDFKAGDIVEAYVGTERHCYILLRVEIKEGYSFAFEWDLIGSNDGALYENFMISIVLANKFYTVIS